jgi:hypothetical protein
LNHKVTSFHLRHSLVESNKRNRQKKHSYFPIIAAIFRHCLRRAALYVYVCVNSDLQNVGISQARNMKRASYCGPKNVIYEPKIERAPEICSSSLISRSSMQALLGGKNSTDATPSAIKIIKKKLHSATGSSCEIPVNNCWWRVYENYSDGVDYVYLEIFALWLLKNSMASHFKIKKCSIVSLLAIQRELRLCYSAD